MAKLGGKLTVNAPLALRACSLRVASLIEEKDLLDIEVVTLPLFGQQQRAVTPAKQLQPEEVLQRLDLVAHRGPGHEQLFRRLGETQVASGRIEHAQRIEGGKRLDIKLATFV